MFTLRLACANRMNDFKAYFGLVGPLGLAVALPWIAYRMFGSVCLRRGYNELAGKVVVITGASSGLGEALAHAFYERGARVVLCARRRHELERVRAQLLRAPCHAPAHPPVIVPIDLSDADFTAHIDKILSITDRIDILVNNAGVSHRGRAIDTSLAVDRALMAVNYFGPVALTKGVLRHMRARRSGRVIFVSSVQGLMALPDRSAYCASKHALQAFADSVRAEVAADNVRVTVISPGYVKTALSLNALTGDGARHGVTDVTTERGMDARAVADVIVRAAVTDRKEAVIAAMVPRLAVWLRHSLPALYFWVMERRARASAKNA